MKGFFQRHGINLDEMFFPVVKVNSIRVILGRAASMDLELEKLDVKTTFPHSDLKKNIYKIHPTGRKMSTLFVT